MSAPPFFPNPVPGCVAAADRSYKSYGTHRTHPTPRTSQPRRTRQTSPVFRKSPVLAAALTVLLLPAASFAQVLTAGLWKITSSTADNGGGRSTAGPWTLTGTLGQPDASSTAAASGAFAITGGFWADAAVIPTGNNGPQLTISRLGAASVELAWPAEAAGWTLQKSTDLTSWSDVQGIPAASAPGTGAWPLSTGPRHFFRLILK